MPWRRRLALATMLALAGALAAEAQAQPHDGDRGYQDRDDWVLLGRSAVGLSRDRDIIVVDHEEGWYRNRGFRRLHLIAEGSDIHLLAVQLVYINGYAERVPVDRLIRNGQDQPIDLHGERKYIRRIALIYRAGPDPRGGAGMRVYGELSSFARLDRGDEEIDSVREREWVELGCQRVSPLGVDRDAIGVGKHKGFFAAIRVRSRNADIRLRGLTVVYASGQRHELQVRSRLRQGSRTRPLALDGGSRAIRRIEMTYSTILNFKGLARVCVEGLR